MLKIIKIYYFKIVLFYYNFGFLGSLGMVKKVMGLLVGLVCLVFCGFYGINEMCIWVVKFIVLVVQNMMLVFCVYGYDICLMEGFDECWVNKILVLFNDVIVMMILGVGKCVFDGIYYCRYCFFCDEFVYYIQFLFLVILFLFD